MNKQRRALAALAVLIADYEQVHGEITPDEIQAANDRARARALSVRSGTTRPPSRRRKAARP